jgi:hypothetical protein
VIFGVGHAVDSRKSQAFGQLPKRRLGVAPAEPDRDRPRRVGSWRLLVKSIRNCYEGTAGGWREGGV